VKRAFVTVLTTIGVTIAIAAQGPGRGPAQTQSPRPLVGETMPIGGDIARTIHFYHDLLGLQCRSGDPRARLGWYDTRPFLEDMYAVVGGQLRNVTFLVPGSPFFTAGEEMQIEPIEFNRATGKPLHLRPQDPGASRMIFRVTNIDKLAGYIKQGGAKVVTTGGVPIAVEGASGPSRAIVFDDGNGFLVDLVQADMLRSSLGRQPIRRARSSTAWTPPNSSFSAHLTARKSNSRTV